MTPTQVSTAIDQLSDIFAAIPPEEVWQATHDMPSEHLGELYRRMDNLLIAATKFKMSILGSHLTPPLLGAIPDQAELMSLLYAIDPTKLSRDALGAIGVEVCNKLGWGGHGYRLLPPALAEALAAHWEDEEKLYEDDDEAEKPREAKEE